jgi:hypothetical protein
MSDQSVQQQQGSGNFPDTITLEQGIEYTTNWRNYMEGQGSSDYIRAFYIPLDDIINLGNITQQYQGQGIRAYVGLEKLNDPATAKLVLVPTAGPEPGTDITSDPETGDSTVFDFTSPCPSACDLNSPLFNG